MSPTGYPDYPTSLSKPPALPIFKPPMDRLKQFVNKIGFNLHIMELSYLLLPVMVYHASQNKPVNSVGALVMLCHARWLFADDESSDDSAIDLVIYYDTHLE